VYATASTPASGVPKSHSPASQYQHAAMASPSRQREIHRGYVLSTETVEHYIAKTQECVYGTYGGPKL